MVSIRNCYSIYVGYLILLVRGRNLGYPFVSGRDVNVGIADMEEENLFYNPYILYRKVILV